MGWSSIGTVVGGGQLATAGGTPVQPVTDQLTSGDLGTGADGTVILVADTTLVRDMQYAALTVGFGTTLHTASYVIRCQGLLTNDGTIANNGGDATAPATPGSAAPTGTLLGSGAGVSCGGNGASVSGLAPPAADVQGGGGGGASGGTTKSSGAIGLSMPGLRSLLFAGGASGGVQSSYVNGGAASGGGGGVVIVFTDTTAGVGAITADAGASVVASTGGYASGSGGGIVYIACRKRGDQWSISAAGSAGVATGTGAPPGFPGRTGVLVCNGS